MPLLQPHSMDSKAVLARLASSEAGLSPDEAAARLKLYGSNQLKEIPPKPLYLLFFEQFTESVVLLLIAAGVITFLIGEQLDSAAIFAIVVLNAVFGFVQEYRAEKAIEALRKLMAPSAKAVRGGAMQQIPARELVPGDVVSLEAGDQVPADCRLLSSQLLSLVEAPLTGESAAVSKDASLVLPEKTLLAERKNLVFSGTVVARGTASAVVVSTGMETEFGKIAGQVQQIVGEATPLEKNLEELGKKLSIAAVALVVVIFFAGVLRGIPVFSMFLTAVSLAVAAVPEGLPAIVTITLAIGVQRMIKRNAVLRRLHAVETLGSADIICSDKTGTLTKNEMTVRSAYFNGVEVGVSGSGYEMRGSFSTNGSSYQISREFQLFLRAGALCTTAELGQTESGPKPVGDGTELALVVLAAKAGLEKRAQLVQYKQVGLIPFEAERRMMSSIHENSSDSGVAGRYLVFCKGAPEVVFDKCADVFWGDRIQKLSQGIRHSLALKADELASRGLRVLAVAFKQAERLPAQDPDEVEQGLVFLGLVGMNDPPREEVKQAVALCKSAGIRVIMITGDNPLTAKSVAQEIGIAASNGVVLTGAEIEELSDGHLAESVETVNVIARVSPLHKLRIVTALKSRGHVVAMTGDGVNDAPALKKADIGVAMGITGTDVSKEASDMILADDNFASIVNAVEEGRTIFDNIMKSVRYLLSCNSGELIAVFSATMLSLPLPLQPIQILWMNLVTDGLPALALGMERPEPDVMNRPPRSPGSQILSGRNLLHLAVLGLFMAAVTLLLFLNYLPEGLRKAQTVAFSSLVFLQFAHSFNSRSRKHSLFSMGLFENKLLWLAVLGGIALQVAIVQTSVLESVFETVPLNASEWLLITASSLTVFVCYEAWKALKSRVPGLLA